MEGHAIQSGDGGSLTRLRSVGYVNGGRQPNIGLRVGLRLTPTYIKSDAAGWWCDPYWRCYVVGDAQNSNESELAGGVLFRF